MKTNKHTQQHGQGLTTQQKKAIMQHIFKILVYAASGGNNNKPGYACSIKRRDILGRIKHAGYIRAAELVITDRLLRKIYAAMVRTGYPVGSHSTYGYFFLKTIKDKRLAQKQAFARGRAAFVAAAKIEKNFSNKTQRKIFNILNSPVVL